MTDHKWDVRVCTKEIQEHVVANWHAGLIPGTLHEALGWSWEEYQRYENAVSGASDEDPADVLASYAPKIINLDERPFDNFLSFRDGMTPADGRLVPDWNAARAQQVRDVGDSIGPPQDHTKVSCNILRSLRSDMMGFTAPALARPIWHTAKVAGQERWIVRDTSSGVARLAPLPNDFSTPDAAQRRADVLNQKDPLGGNHA